MTPPHPLQTLMEKLDNPEMASAKTLVGMVVALTRGAFGLDQVLEDARHVKYAKEASRDGIAFLLAFLEYLEATRDRAALILAEVLGAHANGLIESSRFDLALPLCDGLESFLSRLGLEDDV